VTRVEKIKRVLKAIASLERYLNRSQITPATGLLRSAVLLPLLSKALTVGRAICVLVDAGFPAEAFGMSRTIIEMFFTVRYITNKDTERRAERYVKYHARVRVEWKKIIDEHFPATAQQLGELNDEILEKAGEYNSRIRWA